MKSIQQLEIDDGELRALRERLSAEKHALQLQLSEIKAKCASRLPYQQYQRLQRQRADVIKLLTEKEQEFAALRAQRVEIATTIEVCKTQTMSREQVYQLTQLRDKSHAFSMDPKNHKSAREVAWKFSQELRTILKSYFDANQPATESPA